MSKLIISAMIVSCGLMMSCHPASSEQGKATEKLLYVRGDSVKIDSLYQRWKTYVHEHPKDEQGWRNYVKANLYYHANHPEIDNEVFRKDLLKRIEASIPNTYTYYYLVYTEGYDLPYKERAEYAEKALQCMPEEVAAEDYERWCVYLYEKKKDMARFKEMLTRYYNSGLFPQESLMYQYNELQGMEEGGILLAESGYDFIGKWILQYVLGEHRDKKLVYKEMDCEDIWRQLGIPAMPGEFEAIPAPETNDNESYHLFFGGQMARVLLWIHKNTTRPIYVSASEIRSYPYRYMPDSIMQNFYNEGLTVRYSTKPYDNMKVKLRNVEERYLLEYLRKCFHPYTRSGNLVYLCPESYIYDYTILLRDLLPYYKKHNPARCQWLSQLLLDAIETGKTFNDDYFSEKDVEEIKQYLTE